MGLQNGIFASATTIKSTLGGSAHVHLGSTISDAMFSTITGGYKYTAPSNPGDVTHCGNNSSGETRSIIFDQFMSEQAFYQLHCNVEAALNFQLIAAVETMYLDEKRDQYMEFMKTTTLKLLIFLFDKYGKN